MKMYFRGILALFVEQGAVSVSFNPIWNPKLRREEISLCDASRLSPEDAAKIIAEHSGKQYQGSALMLKDDFDEVGFTIIHDGSPFEEHCTAFIELENPMNHRERQRVRRTLERRAASRGDILIFDTPIPN